MKLILIIAVVVIIVVLLARSSKRGQESSDDDATPLPSREDPDEVVLKQLAASGSDLGLTHDIKYFLYFPNDAKAREAGKELVEAGYNVEINPSNDERSTLCLAKMSMVPSQEAMAMARRKLSRVAAAHGGEYDGWETAVQRGR